MQSGKTHNMVKYDILSFQYNFKASNLLFPELFTFFFFFFNLTSLFFFLSFFFYLFFSYFILFIINLFIYI